jgi:hypothetical protein
MTSIAPDAESAIGKIWGATGFAENVILSCQRGNNGEL